MGEAGGLSPQPCRAHLPVGVWCRQVGEHLPSPLHATGCLTWAQKPRPGARLPPDGQQEASAAALMVGGQAPLHPALIDLGAVPRCPVTHSSRARSQRDPKPCSSHCIFPSAAGNATCPGGLPREPGLGRGPRLAVSK